MGGLGGGGVLRAKKFKYLVDDDRFAIYFPVRYKSCSLPC
jgi:hypothetical protein